MIRRVRCHPCRYIVCACFVTVVTTGCGSSQSVPSATATPAIPFRSQTLLDHQAVAVAIRFLHAYKTDNRQELRRLMSARLLRLNRFNNLQQMLAVQSPPVRIDLMRAHTFRARRGRWTRVVARLEFDHGTTVDAFTVIRRSGKYRIWNIKELRRRVGT